MSNTQESNENNVARCLALAKQHEVQQREQDQQGLQALVKQQRRGRQEAVAQEWHKPGSADERRAWAQEAHEVRNKKFREWAE